MTDRGSPIIHTAQTRLYINTSIGANAALAALGFGPIQLPVYVELAEAQAKLDSISCVGGAANARVALDVLPSIGHASIATIGTSNLNNFATPVTEGPVTIIRAPLASVTGQARADIGGGSASWQTASFSASDIADGTTRTVSTGDTVSALSASLVQNMNLNVSLLGLGLNLSTVTSLVGGALQTVAPTLDGVLNGVTDLLGIHLGQADTRVNGVRCGIPALVG
ncbi:MAG: hypothetical protein JOY99_08050 [Sphingomonadaceae bacterium]|nr:hypothetical protein [Sphingomonadaceae bacterium]